MLSLLSVLRMDRFTPRFYIAAATDNMSLHKARSFEHSLADKVYWLFADFSAWNWMIRQLIVADYVFNAWYI